MGSRHLPEGYTTVGSRVCIEHVRAVGVGKTVVARITLVKQNRRRLEFAVEVLNDASEVIGRGEHTRFIVDEQKFIEKSIIWSSLLHRENFKDWYRAAGREYCVSSTLQTTVYGENLQL